MPLLAALPQPVALAATFVLGVIAGAAVNWAAYTLAWNRRPISPWSRPHAAAPNRRATDRIPVWGWVGLRREESLHGRGHWARPLAIELVMGAGVAALWWWHVERQGLVASQFEALAGGAAPPGMLVAPTAITYATFVAHVILLTLMAAASLIDIDEKTIPDEITIPGTLAGLALATAWPMTRLPHVAIGAAAPPTGVEITLPAGIDANGGRLFVEPMGIVTPNAWPTSLEGAPAVLGLAVGLACYALWCFALTPREWRGRRGVSFGMRILLARVARELSRPPLSWIALAGVAAIVTVWWRGGAAWVGMLSALVGMLGGGAIVWAVRLFGSAAMRREALGFGDVTLMMMVGAFLGWQAGVVTFFLSPIAALVVGVLQLVLRRNDEIFFGPFLSLAAVVVMVRWATLWNADSPLQAVFASPGLVVLALGVGMVLLWAMLVLWRHVKEALFRPGDA